MKKEEHKEIHWFERLEADIADTESPEFSISKEEWQKLRKSLNFEKHLLESYRWVYETSLALGHSIKLSEAYHALRGVLFTLRDRLPEQEVFQLSAQMPAHLRGIFFEGYNLKDKPVKMKADEFLNRIKKDMPPNSTLEAKDIFKGVLQVLYSHITDGEMQDIYATLPQDIKVLWDEARK